MSRAVCSFQRAPAAFESHLEHALDGCAGAAIFGRPAVPKMSERSFEPTQTPPNGPSIEDLQRALLLQ